MILPSGTQVDEKYEIRRTIGSGGMGVVYEACQEKLDRLVALKIVTNHSKAIDAARFEREALSLSKLSHPNIVRFLGYGRWEGVPYMVMELLTGQSLQQRLSDTAIDPTETLAIVRQICSGLSHAHLQGVIHRDIKPSNILLCDQPSQPEARVKVIDFGLAKIVGYDVQKLTQTGIPIGSLLYISPEQALGQPVDARTDIYGVGCILFQCLTGVPPFCGENAMALLLQHAQEPVNQSEYWNDIPPAFQQIIGKCLAKKPAERYQSVAALDSDLALVESGCLPKLEGGNASALHAPPMVPNWLFGKFVRDRKSHQSIAIVATTCALTLFVALAFIVDQVENEKLYDRDLRRTTDRMRFIVATGQDPVKVDDAAEKELKGLIEESKRFSSFDPDLLFQGYVIANRADFARKPLEYKRQVLKEIVLRCLNVRHFEFEYLCKVLDYQYVCALEDPTLKDIYFSCVPDMEAAIAAHSTTAAHKQLALVQFELAARYGIQGGEQQRLLQLKNVDSLYAQAIPYLEGNYLNIAEGWRKEYETHKTH